MILIISVISDSYMIFNDEIEQKRKMHTKGMLVHFLTSLIVNES